MGRKRHLIPERGLEMKKEGVLSMAIAVLLASSYIADDALARPSGTWVIGRGSSTLVVPPPPEQPGMMQFAGSVELLIGCERMTADLIVNVYSVVENAEGVREPRS